MRTINHKTTLGKIMDDRGLTMEALEASSGVDRSMICRLANGQLNDIFISKDAVPIAAALGLPVADVFPEFFSVIRKRSRRKRESIANTQQSIAC
jgi:transcriptional regulator with XRE-family HTH domain